MPMAYSFERVWHPWRLILVTNLANLAFSTISRPGTEWRKNGGEQAIGVWKDRKGQDKRLAADSYRLLMSNGEMRGILSGFAARNSPII
jgi:hypothetical protein